MATTNRFAAARDAAAKEEKAARAATAEPETASKPATEKAARPEAGRGGESPKKASAGKRREPGAKAAPGKGAAPERGQAHSDEKSSRSMYGFQITEAQNKALNRLKGIDGLERSLVVREALDEWIASHAAEYPESLGQYGK